MIVTKTWIMDNRTTGGAWTKVQLAALGIDWPPPKGWLQRLEGTYITSIQRHNFEFGAGITAKFTKMETMTDDGKAMSASQTMLLYIRTLTDNRMKKVYLAVRAEVKRRKLEF